MTTEDYWKKVAHYLADCHADNLEGLPRSTSNLKRYRMFLICERAVKMLYGSWPYDVQEVDDLKVKERLRRNIKCL